MLLEFQEKYNGTKPLSSPTGNLSRFRGRDGAITKIDIWLNAPLSSGVLAPSAALEFNAYLNGVALFDPEDRFIFGAGDETQGKTGLSIATTKGDVLSFNVDRVHLFSVVPPVFFQVTYDIAAGGASAINDLTDVDTVSAAPSPGDLLQFDGTNWVPYTPSAPVLSIDDLTDVDTTSAAPSPGDLLQWDGTNWVPVTITLVTSLDDLSDVDTVSTPPNSGDNLTFNGTLWVPQAPTGGPVSIDDLSDVDTVSAAPSVNDSLKWDGTNWVPYTPAGGSAINVYHPDLAYASPSTEDDEFNAGSLDAKWTAVNGGITTTFDIPNMVSMVPTGNNLHGIYQAFSSANSVWIMKLHPVRLGTNASKVGILFRSGSNEYDTFYFNSGNNLEHGVWSSTTNLLSSPTFLTTYFSAIAKALPIYLRVDYTHSGATTKFYHSLDGVNWNLVETSTTAFAASLTHVGIYCGGSTSAEKGRVDWFRKLQGAYIGGNI